MQPSGGLPVGYLKVIKPLRRWLTGSVQAFIEASSLSGERIPDVQQVFIQFSEGPPPRTALEYLLALGVRIVFPAHEYRPAEDDTGVPAAGVDDDRTVRLPQPYEGDGGYAERFLYRRNADVWRRQLTRDS